MLHPEYPGATADTGNAENVSSAVLGMTLACRRNLCYWKLNYYIFCRMSDMEVDTSIAMPSPSVRRRQSCYAHHSEVGVLPAVKLLQSGARPVLGEHNSCMLGADNVRVRVAPPDPIRTTLMWYMS